MKTIFQAIPMLAAFSVVGLSCDDTTDEEKTGDDPVAAVELASAGSLEFGPDGVLFLGDSYGSKVWAIETGDTTAPADGSGPAYLAKIDEALASLMGAEPHKIRINDMAVNPVSQNIYFSVHVGRSRSPQVALARFDRNTSELTLVDLDQLEMTEFELTDAPSFEDTYQYGQSARTQTITDLTYYNGQLLIAGVSNQEFTSTLRRVAYPFDGEVSTTTLEVYHAAHGRQETRAPIVTSEVMELDGKPYLLAAYTCTPLVRFDLEDLVDGAHVVGDTIAELGFGNAPIDMLTYTDTGFDGTESNPMLLVTNDARGSTSISRDLIASAPTLSEPSLAPTGLEQVTNPGTGHLHMDMLNGGMVVVVRRNLQTGDLSLMSILTGIWFAVSESLAQYNTPLADEERSQLQEINDVNYGLEDH